jgi:NADH:ubiquinone oxidoreductase subunit F (NADH-binding)
MAIVAHGIGSTKAFIYIRGEFRWISEILEAAIAEAGRAGLLGDLDIIVHRGAGSYVCGEETALVESIEGNRGNPHGKPPFPAHSGLYGCPTIVNNVETLACVPVILDRGAEAFRAMGCPGGYGPKIFGVSGHVNRPGLYEFPLGTPLTTILEAAGGVRGNLKGVIVGGLSVPILKAGEIEGLRMDYDSCVEAGTMLGSGGIIVINDTVSIPRLAARTIRFYAHESCGQCTPCREGSQVLRQLLQRLLAGDGVLEDIDRILHLCGTIKGLTICPAGLAFALPIRAMLEKYRSEFEALIPSLREPQESLR